MTIRPSVLVALAGAVTLVSVEVARPHPATQQVAVAARGVLTQGTVSPSGFGEFVLTPVQAGALERDSGTMTTIWRRVVVRDDRTFEVYDAVSTWNGTRGRIVLLERVEWLDAGDGSHPATGTWTVMRGTGRYARITGGGRSSLVWLERGPWSSRFEGSLTLR